MREELYLCIYFSWRIDVSYKNTRPIYQAYISYTFIFLYNYILIYIDKKSKEQQIDLYTKKMASQLQFLDNFLGKLTKDK